MFMLYILLYITCAYGFVTHSCFEHSRILNTNVDVRILKISIPRSKVGSKVAMWLKEEEEHLISAGTFPLMYVGDDRCDPRDTEAHISLWEGGVKVWELGVGEKFDSVWRVIPGRRGLHNVEGEEVPIIVLPPGDLDIDKFRLLHEHFDKHGRVTPWYNGGGTLRTIGYVDSADVKILYRGEFI